MEEILKLFQAFISFLTSTISSLTLFSSSISQNPPRPPTPAPAPLPPAALVPDNDQLAEMIIPIDPTTSSNNSSNSSSSSDRDDHKQQHKDLPGKMIIEFCFTTAIALLVVSYQNQNDAHHILSFSFHILCLSILLAFTTSWGGILLRLRYSSTAKVLEQMGIMFAALAFFLAMEISVPPSLKWITWFISASSLLFLFIHYIYGQKDLMF